MHRIPSAGMMFHGDRADLDLEQLVNDAEGGITVSPCRHEESKRKQVVSFLSNSRSLPRIFKRTPAVCFTLCIIPAQGIPRCSSASTITPRCRCAQRPHVARSSSMRTVRSAKASGSNSLRAASSMRVLRSCNTSRSASWAWIPGTARASSSAAALPGQAASSRSHSASSRMYTEELTQSWPTFFARVWDGAPFDALRPALSAIEDQAFLSALIKRLAELRTSLAIFANRQASQRISQAPPGSTGPQ